MSKLLFVCLLAFTLVACNERKVVVVTVPATPIPEPVAKTRTFETKRLANAIDTFEREPSNGNRADVDKAIADLDGEIAELETDLAKFDGSRRDEAAAKLKNLRSYRDTQALRFTALKAQSAAGIAPPADDRSGAQKVGDKVEEGAHKVGEAGRKVGEVIKDATR